MKGFRFVALMAAGVAAPMAAAAAESSNATGLEEVVVTGTRLNVDGSRAPTPVTVIGLQEINQQAPKDITEVVNQIPSVVGSMTPVGRSVQASNGTSGISAPALRGMGSNRTLVLLDGQRSPSVTQTGETDVELFPQQLISRVDVVTGGASAAYGSDALAGVVNFILDRDFTGVKAELSGGLSNYGDDQNYKAVMSAGFGFAGDRGHVLLSGSYDRNRGIFGDELATRPKRDWMYGSPGVLFNPAYTPTNGLPQFILVPRYASATATKGGLIVGCSRGTVVANPCPVRGTAFAPNGSPYQFNFGTLDLVAPGGIPAYMSGGDWEASEVSGMWILDPRTERGNFFTRVAWDLTDNVNVYAQAAYGDSYTRGGHSTFAQQGDLVIQADNAFIPASVRTQLQAQGITSFRMGRFKEGERQGGRINRAVRRFVLGADGDLGAFGRQWDWSAYYQRGQTNAREEIMGIRLVTEYNNAVDAVINPANGAIICRSTLANPGNGCVPYNVFGFGTLDPAVDGYAFGGGNPIRAQHFIQNVVAAEVRGEPFSTWAGPVSMAVGAEHRIEEAEGTVDPRSAALRWQTNYIPLNGKYDVTEGFLETSVPIARDKPLLQALDINGAFRATDYSVSGFEPTWKAGLTWSPVEDMRFRVTRSRDIRAPNLAELFTLGTQITSPVTDPFRNGEASPLSVVFTTGNLELEPERADTFGVGVVLQPRFLEGLTASVDYYKIKVGGAIGTTSAQLIINQCFAGRTQFCPAIERAASGTPVNGLLPIVRVRNSFFNFTSQLARGVDFEVSYRMGMDRLFSDSEGRLTFRAFLTRFLENTLDNGISPPVDLAGDMRVQQGTPALGAIPNWKGTASITWDREPLSIMLATRAVSTGEIKGQLNSNALFIQCTSGCPPSTPDFGTIDDNSVAGAVYFDASITYSPEMAARPEFFLSVRNITDRDPAMVARGPGQLAYGVRPTNEWIYDVIGRAYRAGVRFSF